MKSVFISPKKDYRNYEKLVLWNDFPEHWSSGYTREDDYRRKEDLVPEVDEILKRPEFLAFATRKSWKVNFGEPNDFEESAITYSLPLNPLMLLLFVDQGHTRGMPRMSYSAFAMPEGNNREMHISHLKTLENAINDNSPESSFSGVMTTESSSVFPYNTTKEGKNAVRFNSILIKDPELSILGKMAEELTEECIRMQYKLVCLCLRHVCQHRNALAISLFLELITLWLLVFRS